MRISLARCLALLGSFSCAGSTEPEWNLTLETDQVSYIASVDPDPRFDHTVRVIVKLRNESSRLVRINRCTPETTYPPYALEPDGGGVAAWTPNIVCTSGVPSPRDVAGGLEITDTLFLHAPWERLFNGQPVGTTEGNFRILYEVQICGSVTRFGQCVILNRYNVARSNRFAIQVP